MQGSATVPKPARRLSEQELLGLLITDLMILRELSDKTQIILGAAASLGLSSGQRFFNNLHKLSVRFDEMLNERLLAVELKAPLTVSDLGEPCWYVTEEGMQRRKEWKELFEDEYANRLSKMQPGGSAASEAGKLVR